MFKMVQTADYHTVCIFDQGNANVIDLGYNDGSSKKTLVTYSKAAVMLLSKPTRSSRRSIT